MKKIILLFLLFASFNVFSQSKSDTVKIPRWEWNNILEALDIKEKKYEDSLLILSDSLEKCESFFDSNKEFSGSLLNIGTYYALIIGVDNYSDMPVLEYPIEDATRLRNALVNYYNFDSLNITLLPDPTQEDILNEFQTLDEKLDIIEANDNVLIFFAGHGGWDELNEEGYWCPSDALDKNYDTWISQNKVKSKLTHIANKARNTLLITDACFGGSILLTNRGETYNGNEGIESLYMRKSFKAITSGGVEEVKDRSKFIQSIIVNLENNQEPELTATELFGIISMVARPQNILRRNIKSGKYQ